MIFLALKVTMVGYLKIMLLKVFAMSLALNINSHHQGPLNKIELMRETRGLLKKGLELC